MMSCQTNPTDYVLLGLPHVLPLAVQLEFVCWKSAGDHSNFFLLFEFLYGTPPSFLKVGGWVGGGWVAYSILVSAQGPLVLGLGLKGLGLRVWGQGLTIRSSVYVWFGYHQPDER